ncbi:MAG: phosphoglycerate mutase GpmB [Chlamydiae bacterium]|nr:phosphoglycerate mutase GpmB [Chlamydiota bacterium]
MTKEIFLIRHGETELNCQGVLQGSFDAAIGSVGRLQAKTKAEEYQSLGIDLILTSPLQRTFETAQIVASKLNVNFQKEGFLSPRKYGPWENTSIVSIKNKHKNLLKDYQQESLSHIYNNSPINGVESYSEVADRFTKGLLSFLKSNQHQKLLCITHSGVLTAILLAYSKAFCSIPIVRLTGCVSLKFEDGRLSFAAVSELAQQASSEPFESKILF